PSYQKRARGGVCGRLRNWCISSWSAGTARTRCSSSANSSHPMRVNTPAAAQERQGRRHAEFTHRG
ncbi:hypothetical protein, partial [Rhodococcus yananensis]|uniref:hypothetical protein n=1 Tax=Rhodococcus yananensis TaxID=2879464 RepID=UPI001CF8DE6E